MPFIFKKYYHLRDIVFFLGEGLFIFLSILAVEWFFQSRFIFSLTLFEEIYRAAIVVFVFQLCLYFFDLYDLKNDLSLMYTATRITQAFGVGCIVLGGIYYSLPQMIIPSKVFWVGYLIICLTILLWRAMYYIALRRRMFIQQIILLGTGKLAEDIAQELEGRHNAPYKIMAFIGDRDTIYNPHNSKIFHDIKQLNDFKPGADFDRIVIALDDRRGTTPIKTLLKFKMMGIAIEQGISFYERITGRLLVENMEPSWIIFSEGFSLHRSQYLIKRAADIILSFFALLISLPIIFVSGIIIKLESKGPVFYSQRRVGLRNVPYKIYKLRSMRQDAEQNGAVWAEKDDPRITRFGRFIRKFRIDELPQLWNVLKGNMSFVGPRPERPVFVEEFADSIPFYPLRHNVKPGITGWAQVCYPYGASREDTIRKLEYDLFYIKNVSFLMDFLVVFMTVKTVLFKKGSR